MRARNLTLPKLAIKAGMDKGNLYRIVKTGRGFSSESLEKIAGALGVMIADLFADGDNVQMLEGGGERVPVLDPVQVGIFPASPPYFRESEVQEYITMSNKYSEKTFAMRVVGDSMVPEMNDGDVIIVDPDTSPRPGSFVVASEAGHAATLKKYAERGRDAHGHDVFELIPSNPLYSSMRSDILQLRIIGVVRERIIKLL
jgi:SOS-response transcriptional repressor LexA